MKALYSDENNNYRKNEWYGENTNHRKIKMPHSQ